jgi:mRNA interferase RelE/StbE
LTTTRKAEKDLRSLPDPAYDRVDARILALAGNPHPPDAVKVRASRGLFRVRVGDYRILFVVDDDTQEVTIARVGHRREVYRDL